ncbi:MAG: hypothetical protein ACKO2P_03300 [Planctomycetota bacterium]
MATPDSTAAQTPALDMRQLAERLLSDHQLLMRGLGCHQEWIHQLSEIGMPRFGELACRLEGFRAELARHFQNEEHYGERLQIHGQSESVEGAAGGDHQHQQLLEQLSLLIQRLRRGTEEFHGWNVAVGEVGALVSEICEHERREMEILRQVTGRSRGVEEPQVAEFQQQQEPKR